MAMPNYPGRSRQRRIVPPKKAKAKGRPKPKTAKKPAAAPFDANAPLTADTLNQNVAAATNLQFGGAEAELQGQRGVNQQMQANIPAWFAEYQAALAQSTQRTQQAYAGAVGVQQNTAATAGALDAQQRAALMQGAQADAATRGAVVDPAIAAQGQQAAASRQSMMAAQTGLTAGLGAAEVGFRANRQVVGAGQKLSAQQTEAQRGRNIGVQAIDLARQKGAAATTTRQNLIDKEHTKNLERKAFGLNEQKAAADVQIKTAGLAQQRAARVTSNRNADQSRAVATGRLTEQQRANRARETLATQRLAKGKAGAKLTPAQRAARDEKATKFRGQIDTAAADAKTLRGAAVPVTTPDGKVETGKDGKPTQRTRKLTESEIRAGIRKKYKDRDIANAAMDLAINGYVSETNQRRLKARHIATPKAWRTSRPKLKASPRPNP